MHVGNFLTPPRLTHLRNNDNTTTHFLIYVPLHFLQSTFSYPRSNRPVGISILSSWMRKQAQRGRVTCPREWQDVSSGWGPLNPWLKLLLLHLIIGTNARLKNNPFLRIYPTGIFIKERTHLCLRVITITLLANDCLQSDCPSIEN